MAGCPFVTVRRGIGRRSLLCVTSQGSRGGNLPSEDGSVNRWFRKNNGRQDCWRRGSLSNFHRLSRLLYSASMPHWERIALVGVGLLGGSLGLAIKERGLATRVAGYVRR